MRWFLILGLISIIGISLLYFNKVPTPSSELIAQTPATEQLFAPLEIVEQKKQVQPSVLATLPPQEVALTREKEPIELWVEALAESANPEDLAIAAALSDRPEEQQDLLMQALAMAPDNILLNSLMLEYCLYHKDDAICTLDGAAQLHKADAENGIADIVNALQAEALLQADLALAQLQAATQKARIQPYEFTFAKALGGSMNRANVPKDAHFIQAIYGGVAALASTKEYDLLQLCQQQKSASAWRQACADVGSKMAQNTNSLYYQIMGNRFTSEFSDDEARATQAEIAMQEIVNASAEDSARFEALLASSEWQLSDAQWQHFMDKYESEGQVSATAYLLATFPQYSQAKPRER